MKLADMVHRAAVVCLAGEHLRGRRDIRQRLRYGVAAAPPPALTPTPPLFPPHAQGPRSTHRASSLCG